MKFAVIATSLALAGAAVASPKVKVVDDGEKDTAIVIKKGESIEKLVPPAPDFQIVDGNDDIAGSPVMVRDSAHEAWRNACKEWKETLRNLNKENQILAMHCGAPKPEKDGDQWVFRSAGTYKLKVRIREKAG